MSTTTKPMIPEPAEQEPAALFRYSTWLHVGAGAAQCEEVDENEGTNICGDRGHFHAWCRLSNPLQQAEIRERALAAKARKVRQLRDPGSDAYELLEEEFDARAREGDAGREKVIEELLALDFWKDYYDSMMEVRQIPDPHVDPDEDPDAKLYRHVADDQARLRRLQAMPESERPKDELVELERHLHSYQDAIDTAMKERQDPKRATLEAIDTNALLDQLRDKRIEAEALREFQRVFEVHEWLSCTYLQPDGQPVFANVELLERSAPEVVSALQATFADLKKDAQEAQGN